MRVQGGETGCSPQNSVRPPPSLPGGTDEFTSSALAETQGTAEGPGQNCGIGES